MKSANDAVMTRPSRYYVLEDMCVTNGEEGIAYRHYDIESEGDSLAELIDNAIVHELTIDGTPTLSIGLYDYDDKVVRRGETILACAFAKGGNK